MLRLGHSSPLPAGAFAALAMLPMAQAQPAFTCHNGKCVRIFYGTAPAASRLRINAHGPVTLEGGASKDLTYIVQVTVAARTEAEGRHKLQQYSVRLERQGGWAVLTVPGGQAMSTVTVKTSGLVAAVVSTSDGAVQAGGIEGNLDVDSGAGELNVDRIGGDVKLVTGGGPIRVGQVGGGLHCSTNAGPITVRHVRGEAILETYGGDILASEAGANIRAETGGGGVHIGNAVGAVTATSGGGEIVVEKAGGVVTLRNMAGPVRVGSAAGVRCESMGGGVRLSNIAGPMRVSTSMGNIMASLMASRLTDSFLATGNGDITVLIPSNLGVTIQARNNMADTLRRIVSEFPGIQARRQGTQVIAEGAINGGGPLLQISGMGGTIFIKRQP
jgi:DUF4097 and DUF4098 domain-containing protein YvlB